MEDPVINPVTAKLLQSLVASPPNSLGLIGKTGIGKITLAEWIIRNIAQDPKLKLGENQKTKLIVSDNNNSITIEQIREINEFVKLRTIGTGSYRRFIVIENAGQMTIQAQNALLKLLEEPPKDTMIMLTIDNTQDILPTVLSRIQTVTIKVPTKEQLSTLFDKDDPNFDRFYLLASGLPGLLESIHADPENHPVMVALGKVRDILGKKSFERLASVNELSTDKADTKLFLEVLARMASVSIDSAVTKSDEAVAQRWINIQDVSVKAREALDHNANAKLVLTDLFLNLV